MLLAPSLDRLRVEAPILAGLLAPTGLRCGSHHPARVGKGISRRWQPTVGSAYDFTGAYSTFFLSIRLGLG